MRVGKFALIVPVMTSTEGRCVAMMRWMPAARAICASRWIAPSMSLPATIMRSAISSTIDDDIGQRRQLHLLVLVDRLAGLAVEAGLHGAGQRLALGLRLGDAGVEAVDVAHAELRHLLVAVLHLAHRPFERDDRLLRVGDDGRQQMRNAVIDRELEHLRIDHDEPALLRLQAVEQRQDHGVDRDRLARAGRAGDERCGMRARSTITGSPPIVLPSAMASRCFDFSKSSQASSSRR